MLTVTAFAESLRRVSPHLVAAARRWRERRAINKTRRALLRLDDAMLRDVGVSRWDLRPGSATLAGLIARHAPHQPKPSAARPINAVGASDACLCG